MSLVQIGQWIGGKCSELTCQIHPTQLKTAPNFTLDISVTDAVTGKPVRADVFLGHTTNIDVEAPAETLQLMCNDVSACKVMLTGTAVSQATNVQVIAPGYEKFSIAIQPHVVRSKRMVMPIKLTPSGQRGLRTED